MIIEAAKAMFFETGYAGTSMDRITAQAGVSKATIYSHFRSKEELLKAMVEEMVLPFCDDYRSTMDHKEDFEEWLLELAGIIARKAVLPEVTALERLVIAEALRFPELGRAFETIAIQATLRTVRPRIDDAIARGLLRPCDPDGALEHFAELSVGALRRKALLNGGEPPLDKEIDSHVRNAVHVFLHGYAGQPTAAAVQSLPAKRKKLAKPGTSAGVNRQGTI